MPIDLVIFDCDGVLIDSEVIACRVYAEQLTQYGYPITAEQIGERFVGRSARDTYFEIERDLGRPISDAFKAQLKAATVEAFLALEAVPYVKDAIKALSQKICVASSTSNDTLKVNLTTTGLYSAFAPHIFSARQVEHGKPAPDLFLFAANQMGVEPARCLVIEDSVPGVTGAVAAGMTVLGFTGAGHCGPADAGRLKAAGATLVFRDMRQLTGIIEELSAGRR